MDRLLLGPLPSAVEVGGRAYAIQTDFRAGIGFERTMLDASLPARAKVARALAAYYPADMPPDAEAAFHAALWFYRGGQAEAASEGGGGHERLYDFAADADAVYAAFYAQYGLDLQTAQLHWWAFRALFSQLAGDHALLSRMAVRAAKLGDVPPGPARAQLARAKARYRLDAKDAQSMRDVAGAVFGR